MYSIHNIRLINVRLHQNWQKEKSRAEETNKLKMINFLFEDAT